MNRTRSAGFVITLEFLLVMALFVLPLLIGVILLGRKLYTLYLNQREFVEQPYSRAVVFDGTPAPNAQVIGPAVGYDPFEAPLVIFRDNSTKAGVVLGVRTDRFTSYGQVFYQGSACTGGAYLRKWDVSVGTGYGYQSPPIGFAYQMQNGSYAMGNPNILYYSATTAPFISSGVVDAGTNPWSVWKSQDFTPPPSNVPPPPCFAVQDGTVVDDLVPATQVIDFNAQYPNKPYRLAFPTPGTGPAVPCPTGECGP